MAPCFQQQVAQNSSCHAWSLDGTLLAVCPNNNVLHVYEYNPTSSTLNKIATLEQHTQLVSSCDWNSAQQLVSVSHDRTAVVWDLDKSTSAKSWQPVQVMVRLTRAALCVAWAPRPPSTQDDTPHLHKFAIGGASGTVAVCLLDAGQGWYTSKLIKRKHLASVTAVAWAPDGQMLATASTDGHCRVLAAGLKDVDGVAPVAAFGSVLYEVEIGAGWVHSVCWSPSGQALAAVMRDNLVVMLSGVDKVATEEPEQHELQHEKLPFLCASFLADDLFVAAGFDGEPWLMVRDDDGAWVLAMSLLAGQGQDPAQQLTSQLKNTSITETKALLHPDAIVELAPLRDAAGAPSGVFSTLGRDGVVSLWDVATAAAEPTG